MTLVSFNYLIFFPIVFILYWYLFGKRKNLQNIFILTANVVFYAWWDYRFLALLCLTVVSTYFCGCIISGSHNQAVRKCTFISGLFLNIGILCLFKYFNFFIQSFEDILSFLGLSYYHNHLNLILPVGISFYTFSALSYLIDVYQKKIIATHDFIAYSAFVTFFPSILSGPISRAQKQLPQFFLKREFDYSTAIAAAKIILWGAFMKLCVADKLGIYVDTIYANLYKHNGTTIFITQILYTIQIYADFAGYSLIAIGSGQLLGIRLISNFNRPYLAKTITEFWRRWHISLTTWFRDYIYIPLGGNRVSKCRWIVNTVLVFTISGLWHGAAYTFIVWGAFHGIIMVIERLIYGAKIKEISDKLSFNNIIRIFITFNIVSIAWIFFRIENISDALFAIANMFKNPGMPFIDIPVLAPATISIIVLLLYDIVNEYCIEKIRIIRGKSIFDFIFCLMILCLIMLIGELNGASFIYFQF